MPIYRHSLNIQTRALAMIYDKKKKVPPICGRQPTTNYGINKALSPIVEDQPPWEWTPTPKARDPRLSLNPTLLDVLKPDSSLFLKGSGYELHFMLGARALRLTPYLYVIFLKRCYFLKIYIYNVLLFIIYI